MQSLDIFMLDVGLTDAQLRDKKTYIGGSSAKDIADGNWLKVYDRMVNDEGEDLSQVFKVQLGHITELFNLTWFAKQEDWILPAQMDTVAIRNEDYPYIGCLPDCIMTKNGGEIEAVIDAKHTGAKAPWWDEQKVAEYYFPQAQHNMIACGIHNFWLSVIFGNEGPVAIEIPYDSEWCKKYIGLCEGFWSHVSRKDPPDHGESLAIPEISLDDMRELDMTNTNMASDWADDSKVFLDSIDAFKAHNGSKTRLKKLIPDDVRNAYGNGIEAKRDKRGVSIREVK
jgi:hypothetical protein